jgi:lysozyme family protein
MTGGQLAMDPANVAKTVHALGGVGTHLRESWRANSSKIDGSQSAIGSDVLGAAFRKVYDPDSQAVRQEAPRVSDAIEEDGRIGRMASGLYQSTDQRAHREIAGAGTH